MTFRFIILTFALILSSLSGLHAQYDSSSPAPDKSTASDDSDAKESKGSKNVNVDMRLAYGQYNNMFSTISLSHEQNDFVYLLNSQFTRSNDYGYNRKIFSNTSYYENKIGFTGNLNAGDGWKTIFDGAVDNASYGMYTNPVYTREEKDKYSLSAMNIVRRSSSFEWNSAFNVAGYTHRLAARESENDEKSGLLKLKGDLGGEIIWSASNRLKASLTGTWNRYAVAKVDSDQFAKGELFDDFKLFTFLRMNIGVSGAWTNDGGMLVMGHVSRPGDSSGRIPIPVNPMGGLIFTGSDFFSVSVQYRHELEPFRAENFYFEQKFVYPEYNLLPTRSHIVDGKADLKVGDVVSLKGGCTVKNSREYYDYVADSAGVLRAHELDTTMLTAKGDGSLTVPKSGI
ncbi:MAG TPA: hypothetical protein VF857_06375, partial [Spirochaetota bacterium]